MNIEKQIAYWKRESDDDWETVKRFMQHESDFHWALFIMHLSVEKALEALVAKLTQAVPPKIHNLLRLTEHAGLQLTKEQVELCDDLLGFCIAPRYPVDQLEFKRSVTKEYASAYSNKAGEFRQWLLQQL